MSRTRPWSATPSTGDLSPEPDDERKSVGTRKSEYIGIALEIFFIDHPQMQVLECRTPTLLAGPAKLVGNRQASTRLETFRGQVWVRIIGQRLDQLDGPGGINLHGGGEELAHERSEPVR